jgi:sporulation protein YlmC with PRC-barrel domain
MLSNASAITGYAIVASDGKIGTVSDFLFDDVSWRIRWLVVHTGSWLSGRRVLLPPSVLGHLDPERHEFSVKLTRQQVEDSPDVATEQPVSRQMEVSIFDYYGWTPYWTTGFYMGGSGYLNGAMASVPYLGASVSEADVADSMRDAGDPHLHSIDAVTGYHVHANDGEIGHVEDFLLQEADWSIRYLIVDTKNWWPGKRVLISPRSAREVNWVDEQLILNVDCQRVRNSPAYEPSRTVDRAFEDHFHRYYSNAVVSDSSGPRAGPTARSNDSPSVQE